MMQQEMNFEKAPGETPSFSRGYVEEELYTNDFAGIRGQKITTSGRNLVPPLSQRLLLGFISLLLWLSMAFLELRLVNVPAGDILAPAFMLFSMGLVMICLVLINVVFCRIGWFWIKRRFS